MLGGFSGVGLDGRQDSVRLVEGTMADSNLNAALAESEKEAAEQKAEKAAFKEKLESSYPGLELITIAGDGNCLFSAAADQVWGAPELHPRMRELVMDYIDQHRGLINNSDDRKYNGNDRTEDEYIRDLRKTSGGIEIYGGRPEMFALQEIFKRPVRLIVQYAGGRIGDDEEFLGVKDIDAPQIVLSHEGGNHFNSLRGPHWGNNLLPSGTVPDTVSAATASTSSSFGDDGSEGAAEATNKITNVNNIVKNDIKNGADVNIKNDTGKTALDDAPNDDIRKSIQQKKNPPIILPPDNIPVDADEERVIVSLLASAASIIALLLHKQERETKEQSVIPEQEKAPATASVPIPVQDDSVAALLATLVPGIGTVATKVYVLPIDRNDMLYLINERGNGKSNRRLITKKDTGAIKDINLSNLSRLTPNAYYGKVIQLTYENQTTVDLQKAGEWIEGIADTTERAIVRKLLRDRNIKIEYSMPLWAKTILDNNTICESFKDRVRKAVRLSREKLAEDDTKKMKDLESLIMEGNPAIANVFQTERVLVTMDNTRRSHAFTVPNPYRASKVRNTYTDATFANPAGKPEPKDSTEKEVISRNTQLVQALIPKELYADKKITRAILEGLWYCGQHPDSRSHPGCFMTRFLGELRGMQRAQGTDQVEKDAQRVVERTNKTLDLIQGIGMDIRTSIIIPPPSQGIRPLNK